VRLKLFKLYHVAVYIVGFSARPIGWEEKWF